MLLLTTALALECPIADAEVCAALDAIATSLEAQTGTPVIHDGAPARLRPATVARTLFQAAEQARSAGGTLEGWSAGTYDTRTGGWTGESSGGVAAGAFLNPSRVYKQRPEKYLTLNAVPGVTGNAGGFPVGGVYGGFSAGRALMDEDGEGAVAGGYARTSGTRGVYFLLALGSTDLTVMQPWYGTGPLGLETRELVVDLDLAPGSATGMARVGAPFAEDIHTLELELGTGDDLVALTLEVGPPATYRATRRPGVWFYPSTTRLVARAADGSELGSFECAFGAATSCSGVGPDGSPLRVSFSDDPNDGFVRVSGNVGDPGLAADWMDVTFRQDDGTEASFALVGTYATTVPVDLTPMEAACPGWTCGEIPWTARLRGAHGLVVGTAYGTMSVAGPTAQIRASVWDVD